MPSQRFHPVLIIPGFMSSGLEVKKSTTASWVGKRVWINLNSLGFQSIYRGSALEVNESLKGEKFSKEQHEEYQEQVLCKSKWLHHISLSEDMITERPGIQVRPISGLQGVDCKCWLSFVLPSSIVDEYTRSYFANIPVVISQIVRLDTRCADEPPIVRVRPCDISPQGCWIY